MGAKSFLFLNSAATGSSYGTLQDGGTTTTATTTTGWAVGTTAGTAYSLQNYNTKQAAGTFGGTAQPSAAPANTGECWRTANTYTGNFEAGTWTVKTSVISSANAASGSGKLRYRIWYSTSQTGASATEITSGTISTGTWSNLTTGAAQNLTGTQSIAAVAIVGAYIFVETACEIDTASGNAAADVLIRIDQTNSLLTTPFFDPSSGGDYLGGTVDAFADGSVASNGRATIAQNVNGQLIPDPDIQYKNTGWYATGSVYESWITQGSPATSSVNPNTGHTLTNVFNYPLTPGNSSA